MTSGDKLPGEGDETGLNPNQIADIAQAAGVDHEEAVRLYRSRLQGLGAEAVLGVVRDYAVESSDMDDGPVY